MDATEIGQMEALADSGGPSQGPFKHFRCELGTFSCSLMSLVNISELGSLSLKVQICVPQT